jgi:3D (Asp-Asp-Asp) domain-containing protein
MKREDTFILFLRILLPAIVLVLALDVYLRYDDEKLPTPVKSELSQEFVQTAHQIRGDLIRAMDLIEEIFGHPVDLNSVRSVPVTITAYTSTVEQCDATPYVTASMHGVRTGVLAVSRDLIDEMGLYFGKRVLIPGHGVFEVRDLMNRRWKQRVDIWHEDIEVARHFGRQTGTLMWFEEPTLVAKTESGTGADEKIPDARL